MKTKQKSERQRSEEHREAIKRRRLIKQEKKAEQKKTSPEVPTYVPVIGTRNKSDEKTPTFVPVIDARESHEKDPTSVPVIDTRDKLHKKAPTSVPLIDTRDKSHKKVPTSVPVIELRDKSHKRVSPSVPLIGARDKSHKKAPTSVPVIDAWDKSHMKAPTSVPVVHTRDKSDEKTPTSVPVIDTRDKSHKKAPTSVPVIDTRDKSHKKVPTSVPVIELRDKSHKRVSPSVPLIGARDKSHKKAPTSVPVIDTCDKSDEMLPTSVPVIDAQDTSDEKVHSSVPVIDAHDRSDEKAPTFVPVSHARDKSDRKAPTSSVPVLETRDKSHKKAPTSVPVIDIRDKSHQKAPSSVPVIDTQHKSHKKAPTSVPVIDARDKSDEKAPTSVPVIDARDKSDEKVHTFVPVIDTRDKSDEKAPTSVPVIDTRDKSDEKAPSSVPVIDTHDKSEGEAPTSIPVIDPWDISDREAPSSGPVIDTRDGSDRKAPTSVPVDSMQDQSDGKPSTLVPVNRTQDKPDREALITYPGLLQVCHLPGFAAKVPHGEIPIEILDYSSVVLRKQCNVKYGLLLPSRVYAHVLEGSPIPETDCIPPDCTAAQMHFVPGHYLMSYQFMRTITVYDSSPIAGRIEQMITQLQMVYLLLKNNPETPIFYCTPQYQPDSQSCGVFVIAFTVALLQRQAPLQRTQFLPSNMRAHLLKYLNQESFCSFPTAPNDMQRMEKYFQSQAKLQEKLAHQKLSKPTKASERVQKHRLMLSAEKKEKLKLKEKNRLENLRKSITPKQKLQVKQHDRARKERFRISLTPEQKAQLNSEDKLRKEKSRKSLTPKQKTQLDLEDKIRKQKCRKSFTPEQKTKLDLEDRVRKEKFRTSLTPKQKTQLHLEERVKKERCRKSLTAKQKAQLDLEDRIRKEKCRKLLTPEQKAKLHIEDRVRKEKCRKSLTPQQKAQLDLKDKARKEKSRISLTPQQKAQLDIEERIRKEKRRKSLTPQRKTQLDLQDKVRKEKSRKSLTPEKRLTENEKYQQRNRAKRHSGDVEEALNKFNLHINEFAEYVCTCCNRMLYRKSVVQVHENMFSHTNEELRQACLTGKLSVNNKRWLCNTCHRYIKRNSLPPQANANNLALPDPPPELCGLTSLEERLLAQRYPFMKLLALPKGRQTGIKGAVVNVPVQAGQVCESLPRTPTEAGFLPLKLKRKLKYSGHHKFQYIRPNRIKDAFQWLKGNNPLYSDVAEKEAWEQACFEEDQTVWNELTTNENESNEMENTEGNEDNHSQNIRQHSNEDLTDDEMTEESEISKLRGIKLDSCVQPADPAVEATNAVLSLAPGEGKKPISILSDEKFEELAFPSLFPSGKFGLTYQRPVPISAKKYFQRRVLEHGGQFAANIEYLFVGQFLSEWQQIRNSISVALRKSFGAEETGDVFTASVFKNPDRIRPLLMKDEAYRFLRPIRGSPSYWQQVMYKLLSAIKQLKIFTWFLTLSAADLRWTDTLQGIARQQGRRITSEELQSMTWEQKCELLRSNPVTAARHFHYKVQCLFTDVILSDATPLGKITNYFYRIEFQQRGSPHAHAILWVEGAPQPDAEREQICEFVDRYVSASIPNTNENLKQLVTDLQKHSHSASCKKKGNTCRFNFPRPPTERTILSKTDMGESHDPEDLVRLRRYACDILNKMKDSMDKYEDLTNVSIEDILSQTEISVAEYHFALTVAAKDATLHLRRKPAEVNINNYNVHILTGWQANMDLQFVVSPYAAIHYITSYVTKDERELGSVLQLVAKEMQHQSISKQMNKVADAFANSRSVSAQEAVYRLLGLPLYSSSFKTVWIPTGFPQKRIRILKAQSQIESMEDDEPDIFVANLVDRYAARPEALDNLCLAEFAMWYEVSGKKETDSSSEMVPATEISAETTTKESQQLVVLSHNLGTLRKKCKPNVIRFHQCSLTKDAEMFYYNKMLLYMPWRKEEPDLLGEFETYSDHYQSQIELIENNEQSIMSNADLVDEAVENYQTHGPPSHMWDQVAPETEHTEADAIEEGAEEDDGYAIINPTEHSNLRFTSDPLGTNTQSLAVELIPEFLSESDYRRLVQSLNKEQRSIFQYILNWCQLKANHPGSTNAEYIFVTGGAGTGKSHLIKAMYNMANLTFRKAGTTPSDIHALLMAPTGTAAFNIGAPTIHAAMLMPKNLKTYIKLSDDKCNTLRVKLQSLKMVIIDEISLVGSDMLVYIDKRLQQIIGSSNPFAGITVVVFGDFYHLPPVAQPFAFDLPSDPFERLSGSVWRRNFKAVELQQIMRQKEDQSFAALLNRVRKAVHTEADLHVLHCSVTEKTNSNYMTNALHIFARNLDVDSHNQTMMHNLKKPIICLIAKEKRPSCLRDCPTSDDSRFTGGVSKEILLCEGSRVMVVRNIDVQDGLVNGAQGIVLGFIPNTTNGKAVKAVIVQFDKSGVGSLAKASSRFNLSAFPANAVPITAVDIRFTTSKSQKGLEIVWTQFPLKLAFACTIHKVQGSTLDNIVVSFKNRFSSGQAYVALSRCRTLKGLQLLDFDPQKIRTNKSVMKEMERLLTEMPLPSPYFRLFTPLTCHSFRIALLNANSAKLHFKDIITDPVISQSDVVALTETHITDNRNSQIDNYALFMQQPDLPKNHHGIALYISQNFKGNLVHLLCTVSIEVMCVEVALGDGSSIKLVLVYRSPSVPQTEMLAAIQSIIDYLLKSQAKKIVLLGDFNIDLMKSTDSALLRLLKSHDFKQLVKESTHRSGSCLDHIYLPLTMTGLVSVLPTYYSDHFFVHVQILI